MVTNFSCEDGGEFRAAFFYLKRSLALVKCGCSMTEEELKWSLCLHRLAKEFADADPYCFDLRPTK